MGAASRWLETTLAQASLARQTGKPEKSLAAVWRFAIMLIRGRGGLHLLESNPDQDLSALGPVPDDVRAIVTRTLGDRPLTVSYADELLAALSDGTAIELPVRTAVPAAAYRSEPVARKAELATPTAEPATPTAEPAAPTAEPIARKAEPAARKAEPAAPKAAASARKLDPIVPKLDPIVPKLAVPSGVEPVPAVFGESSPPPPEVASVFESRAAPSPIPPPMFDARSAPSSVAPESVFDPPEEESPDVEAQAQAIEAAFEVTESEPPARTLQPPRKHESSEPLQPPAASGAKLELGPSRPPRRERGGSRRPDLDHLLDQPLDALDFERPEAQVGRAQSTPASIAPTPPPAAATPVPAAAAAADDFEILVDDEILEIAEDDVELVDDEK